MNKPNGHSTIPMQAPVIHQMLIAYNETTGELGVQGVPQSKVTALGMLDLARFLITTMNQQPSSPIVMPPGISLR